MRTAEVEVFSQTEGANDIQVLKVGVNLKIAESVSATANYSSG